MPEKERPEAGDLGPGRNEKHRKPNTKIPNGAQEIAVYSGRVCLGRVVLLSDGTTFEAFNAEGRSLGTFESAGDAYSACEGALDLIAGERRQ